MNHYVRKLPEHVPMSDHLKQMADGYIGVQVYGKSHYVPLTKEMKKIFGIKRQKDRIYFANKSVEWAFDGMVQVIANSLYLQTRDTVGVEIREDVVKIVEDKINAILAPQIDKEIDKRFQEKLLKE